MANLQSGTAPAVDLERMKRNAIRMALVTFGAATPAFLMYLFLGWRLGDWQFFALAVDVAVFLVIAPFCLLLFRRDKLYLGLTILCTTILLVVLIGGMLVAGLGVVLGLAVIAVMPLLITQLMLPPRYTKLMLGASIATGILSVLLDFYWPFPGARLAVPAQIRTLFTFITIGGVALPFFFIARQFRDYTLRTKLILVAVLVSLIPVVLISGRFNARIAHLAGESANLSLHSAAQQTATRLDTFITSNLIHLGVETELSDLVDFLTDSAQPGVREHALELLQVLSRKPYVSSYALLDSQGRNVLDTLALNIGRDEGQADYFRQPIATQQPYVSSALLANDGEVYFYMSQRVLHPNGREVVGVLRVRYQFAALQQLTAQSNDLVGAQSYALLVDQDLIRLAHGAAPEARLTLIAPVSEAEVQRLQAARRLPDLPAEQLMTDAAEFAAALRNGEPFFTGEVDRELLAVTDEHIERAAVVSLESLEWQVAFVQAEQVFLAPVESQSREVVLIGILVSGLMAGVGVGVAQYLARPISALTAMAEQVAAGNLEARAVAQTNDEIGVLARAFNLMAERLHVLVSGLESRVDERNAALQRRAAYLEAAAEVIRSVGAVLEQDALMQQAADLILRNFDLYHVGFTLLDEESGAAVFVSGAGAAAQALRAQEFRLALDGPSLMARCLRSGAPAAVQDVAVETEREEQPLLPDTRSEAALPLKARGRVLGGLSVQSRREQAFDADTLSALAIIADQVAVGLDNLRLLRESRQALEAERRAYGDVSRAAWLDMLRAGLTPGYRYVGDRLEPIGDVWQPEMEAALQQDRTIISESAAGAASEAAPSATFAVPIKVRGQTIGVLDVRRPVAAGRWSESEVTLMEALSSQLEVALESARLYQDTQRRAARERLVGEATARIRETLDIETVLKTAAAEMRQALELPEVSVRFVRTEESE